MNQTTSVGIFARAVELLQRRFGRVTLWLTLAIVGVLTLGLTFIAVRLGIGIPQPESTQIANIAQASVGPRLFALFQLNYRFGWIDQQSLTFFNLQEAPTVR